MVWIGGGYEPDNVTLTTNASNQMAIKNGGVGLAQLDTNIMTPGTLLATLTFSASTTQTSASLTAYDEYILDFSLVPSNSNGSVCLRINGDTGASNYVYIGWNGSAFAETTANRVVLVGNAQEIAHKGYLYITGRSPTIASGRVGVDIALRSTTGSRSLYAYYVAGSNTAVSTVTVLSDGTANYTGSVKIYGRNF